MAFDPRTGDVIWRTARPLQRESWSTPIVWTHDGAHEIITVGTGRVSAYAASDGAERWWVGGLTLAPITVAVAGDGLLFASSRYAGSESDPIDVPPWDTLLSRYDRDKDGQLAVIEPPEADGIVLRREVPKETPGNFLPWRESLALFDDDKSGIVSNAEFGRMLALLRANGDNGSRSAPAAGATAPRRTSHGRPRRGIPEMPSPLLYRGRLYFVRDGGMVTSYAADSGTVVLDRQRLGALGQYAAFHRRRRTHLRVERSRHHRGVPRGRHAGRARPQRPRGEHHGHARHSSGHPLRPHRQAPLGLRVVGGRPVGRADVWGADPDFRVPLERCRCTLSRERHNDMPAVAGRTLGTDCRN